MEFGILGPLEVTSGGAPVPVGGAKPRALLAVLLLHRDAVVSIDRLVAAVWGDDPPTDAFSGLRTYVSRLRAVLGGAGESPRLRFQAPGYRLAVTADELDAARFERLVAEAHDRMASGDDDRAAHLLDSALALWRGPVLADLEPAALDVQAEVARLEELRLAAREKRAESLLRLGRAGDVVIELAPLVRQFPERERLSVLLMRALYLSGRQADALEVYRNLRRYLSGELGVEPSAETRLAHQQLLEQDPALAPVGAATNLPLRHTSFVGRADQVALVAAALRRTSLVTLTGTGGVGKSRLAAEVARHESARFPDGVWWCELAPLADGSPVGHSVAAALRVRDRHGLTIEQTVIEYLRGRLLLLVLDNCEHVLDDAARLAEAIVAHCPGVAVLATSREMLGVGGEQVWPVPPLPVEEATNLFLERARATRPDVPDVAAADGVVADICRRLDGLPLAIELAAARMRAMSPAEVADRLGDAHLLAGGPRHGQPRHQSLTAAIDWSYRMLSGPEQQMFARLSVFAGGADLAAVHAVCAAPGTSESETLDLVTALLDKSLVTAVSAAGGTRYQMLETLRSYGQQQLPRDGVLGRRHAEYYVELAEQAARGVQGPDELRWRDLTGPDYANLRAAFERALADRDADLALRLVSSLPEVTQIRVGYEAADWAETALDLAGEQHPLFVAAVGAAARGAWNRGDFARARALAGRAAGRAPAGVIARTGYPADVAADVALYDGDVDTALSHYTAQVELARRDGNLIRLVWTLYYVAICYAVRREPELGRPAAEEAFDVAEATANPTARSMARYALGLVLKKSDPATALELFDRAAELAASVANFWWEGIALMEAAATRGVHGDGRAAARAFTLVLEHWERVGDQTQQWLNLRYVVRLLVRLGADADAIALHHCLVAHGKPSPLEPARAARLGDGPDGPVHAAAAREGERLSAAEAVRRARSVLRRYS